jgi:hypothetical protein
MDNDSNSKQDKKTELYEKQMETMKTLLQHGAITKEQYDYSSAKLTEKMGMRKHIQ